jgi:hypothetical protein
MRPKDVPKLVFFGQESPFNTLQWMIARVRELGLGLELDFSAQPDSKKTNYLKDFEPDIAGVYRLTGSINRKIDSNGDAIHESALRRFTQGIWVSACQSG